jgi:hypothetical protein
MPTQSRRCRYLFRFMNSYFLGLQEGQTPLEIVIRSERKQYQDPLVCVLLDGGADCSSKEVLTFPLSFVARQPPAFDLGLTGQQSRVC